MVNKNFTQEDLTKKYEETREYFGECLKKQEPCELATGTGGTIEIKSVGWFKVPDGKSYFVVERYTDIKYNLATLQRLNLPVRD